MYLLDTNIVSMLDPRRHAKAPDLIAWLERNGASLFLSVITIAEMDAGVLKLKRERKVERAAELQLLISNILASFSDRILTIDIETARHAARLGEALYKQPVALADILIAATAVRHGLILLTHNLGKISRLGIAACDPFEKLPPDI